MDQQKAKLIIFDIDGTLADRDTHELLPGVREWFDRFANDFLIALATNQGGVGLRHWMETEGFGKPEDFPTEEQAREHIHIVADKLIPGGIENDALVYYVCFAYQSKKSGKWSPAKNANHEWKREYRKPEPGMLLLAMQDMQARPGQTIFVGDSDEDREAAKAAGCHFQEANWFFQRVRNDIEKEK